MVVELLNENGNYEAKKKFNRLNTDIHDHETKIRQHIESTNSNFIADVCQADSFINQCEILLEKNSDFLNQLDLVVKPKANGSDSDIQNIQKVISLAR